MQVLEGRGVVRDDIPHYPLRWIERIDDRATEAIVQLVDCTVEDGGTLGFQRALTADQVVEFIVGLQGAIGKGCCHALLGEGSAASMG